MAKTLEESNVERILDNYTNVISDQDRYRIVSIVASLAREVTKLANEISRNTVRHQLPDSVRNSLPRSEVKKRPKNKKWYK